MSEPIEDAEFEDLGSKDDPSEKVYRVELIGSKGGEQISPSQGRQLARDMVGPVDRGFFESTEKALARKRREIQQQQAIIDAHVQLIHSGIDLTDALEAAKRAPEMARIRAEARLKAERAEARKAEIQAEVDELEAQQALKRARQQPARAQEDETDRQEKRRQDKALGQARAEVEIEKAALELDKLRAARERIQNPPTPTPPPEPEEKHTLPPEIQELVKRAETFAKIEAYCTAQRSLYTTNHQLGLMTDEQYEDKMDEIENWLIDAKNDYDARKSREKQ